MFEIKRVETINKTFRFPIELIQRLETVAQQEKISMNNLVVQCCEYALQELKPQDIDHKDK